MAIDDVYQAAIAVTVNGINTLNSMYFQQLDDEGAEVPADSLKAALESILLPDWVPMLSTGTTIESVTIRRVLATPDQPYVYNFAGGAGTVATEAMPPNIAVIFSHYSDNNDKTGRGRNYMSGVAESLIIGSVVKTNYVSLFDVFKTTLLSAMVQAPSLVRWTFCHYSAFNGSSDPIIHIEQRMQLRTLRFRNRN